MTDKKDEALKLALNVLVNRVDVDHEAITAIREALAQPEQEPVAWITKNGKGWLRWHKPEDNEKNKDSIPLYTTPPHRKPLSDEQWQVMADTLHCCIARSQKDTIEAALGIKE